jgi:hypothetical protein
MDVCRCKKNRNPAQKCIHSISNQMDFTYFLTIQIDGTDEPVPAVLQKWMEHLVPQLCSILRTYEYIATAWRKVKSMFKLRPVLIVIILSACHLFSWRMMKE